jgi:hypothetical protein
MLFHANFHDFFHSRWNGGILAVSYIQEHPALQKYLINLNTYYHSSQIPDIITTNKVVIPLPSFRYLVTSDPQELKQRLFRTWIIYYGKASSHQVTHWLGCSDIDLRIRLIPNSKYRQNPEVQSLYGFKDICPSNLLATKQLLSSRFYSDLVGVIWEYMYCW